MSSIPNIGTLKRVVTKKIRQTVRRLEKNLENLGRLATPEPSRIPVPVHIPVSPGNRVYRFKECAWQSFFPCIIQLLRVVPQCPFRDTSCNRENLLYSAPIRVLPSLTRRAAKFPAASLFGSSLSHTIDLSIYGARLATSGIHANFHGTRFYSTYSRFSNAHYQRWSWAKINNSIVFKQFSSRTQFHLQKFLSHYRLPTLTQILKKRSTGTTTEWEPKARIWSICNELARKATAATATSVAQTEPISRLRLNALLTQGFHDMVRLLSTEASTVNDGCYVDFKVQPLVFIPEKTMMSVEVLAELQKNLRQFERYLAQLQRDLSQLSDLGELPLRFVSEESVIRVYFPNCDRERLQVLLREKNICSGVIHEDLAQEAQELDRFSNVSSVSEDDILSSYYLSLVDSSCDSDSNVLSIETSSSEFENNMPQNLLPMNLPNVQQTHGGRIEFVEESYCWA